MFYRACMNTERDRYNIEYLAVELHSVDSVATNALRIRHDFHFKVRARTQILICMVEVTKIDEAKDGWNLGHNTNLSPWIMMHKCIPDQQSITDQE